jgi:lipopolysaccharide export system permease protein
MRIHRPQFRLPSTLASYGTSIVAEDAFNAPADGHRPAGWWFKKVAQPADLSQCDSVALDGKPTLLFPKDHPWLAADECFLVSGVRIEQMSDSNFQRMASTMELIAALRNPSSDFGPDVRVSVHSRFVQPLLEITLLFLGLPLVLGRENRNIFMAIGMCGGIVAGFFLVVLTCHGLGNNCLISPALAAWAPLAICLPIAVVLSEPLRE